MIRLKKVLGLAVDYDEEKNLLASKEALVPQPSVRTLHDLKPVLLSCDADSNDGMYFMYRDVHAEKDTKLLKDNYMNYDITIIPPNRLGKEFTKTAGHYHTFVPNTNVTYPEVYEVLNGEANYLLQKEEAGKIVDVIIVKATKGCKVVIPPNYGHITINASDKTLIMGNLVSDKFSSVYDSILEKKGGAYYGVAEGKKISFIPNINYKELPKLRILKPKFYPKFGLSKSLPMYKSFIKNPEKFRFLNYPHEYMKEFSEVL